MERCIPQEQAKMGSDYPTMYPTLQAQHIFIRCKPNKHWELQNWISTVATEAEGLCTNRKKKLVMKESHIPASYDKRSLQQVMYCLVVVVLLSSLDNIGWTGAKWKGAYPKNRPRWGQTTQQCTRHFRLNTYSLGARLPLLKVVARALKTWHSHATLKTAFQCCKNHQNPTKIGRLAN